jgi:hypothetical protein
VSVLKSVLTPINALPARADHTSTVIDTSDVLYMSAQIVWASLTGTLDATIKMEVSNDGTNWVEKSSASFTLTTASGTDMLSLNGVVTEHYYRIKYTHGNVSGGTVSVYLVTKEG